MLTRRLTTKSATLLLSARFSKSSCIHRCVSTTPTLQFQEKDKFHEGDHYCAVPHRSYVELEGPDTAKFLQGLITNHMPKISVGGDGFYAAFLTPTGRMLYDTFIYPVNVGVNFPHPRFIIECPTASKANFIRHIKRYILRAKVKVRDCSEEYTLWNIWSDKNKRLLMDTSSLNSSSSSISGHSSGSGPLSDGDPILIKKDRRLTDIGCFDPRVPGFGYRALVKANEDIENILPSSGDFTKLDSDEYTIRRILHGVPEGVDDFWPESSLPLESNLDYMNGVDFRKGCYVGQELTIRTYHTGVVRKRIVPVQIYKKDEAVPESLSVDRNHSFPSDILPPQTDIKLDGASTEEATTKTRSIGKLCSGIHNIGLALMRLEHVKSVTSGENEEESQKNTSFMIPNNESIRLKPFIPDWWSENTTPQFNQ
ncbi:hypothetical protein BDF20DRAFT_910358 [Mycotypha africana]|uniref:uncharacterized protein n=1 Tax=Mycotypha africana TaxID=64632 RepID=UPI0023009A8A|nr:uncharacterized protein BDF20DRAFT_910358 [Mycotypha africana]KAI8987804.1 hypothetical protein BDF20DRAFT_910358 [Mycotypha africana]